VSQDQDEIKKEPRLPQAPFPTWGTKGITVSDHPAASKAARDVLKEGGNAVDAAVTLSLTLGVVCPQYTGLGGGGFALICLPGMNRPRLFDFRETAPGASNPDMFGDDELTSIRGGLAPGVPGTVAGLSQLLEQFGTISWERALAPGIKMAREGVEVYPNLRRVVLGRRQHLIDFPQASKIFLGQDCTTPGKRMVLTDLANTYEKLAKLGPREFYEGEIAERIVKAVQRHGGIFTKKDMADYSIVERTPVWCNYRGREFHTVGPPSGGGIQVLQMLKMLEPFKIGPEDYLSADCYHLQAEAMRLSFADRSSWIADPDYFDVPADAMLDRDRLRDLHSQITPGKAMELVATPPLERQEPVGVNLPGVGGTAAYAAADSQGGYMVATESVNLWFGSMVIAPGTGVLLNNVMDDFSRKPGTPDAFGLVSSRINQVEPGKRPASSSAPTLVMENGRPVAALASAGGPRIATTVVQMALNHFDHGLNIHQAMDAPRIHHQWLPNELVVEQGLACDVRKRLEQIGHKVVIGPSRSHAAAFVWDDEEQCYFGVGDYRAGGAAAGLH
jgi:gamma-glutamyltranspeptidase/glutathione hydrolase